MVRITAGSFPMGTEDGDPDEKPVHRVTLPAFELDRTEVTVGAYAACVAAGACIPFTTVEWSGYSEGQKKASSQYCNWGKARREQHPINCVPWDEAKKFCVWANKRLPTEEEWEYAARGAEGTFLGLRSSTLAAGSAVTNFLDGTACTRATTVGGTRLQWGASPPGPAPLEYWISPAMSRNGQRASTHEDTINPETPRSVCSAAVVATVAPSRGCAALPATSTRPRPASPMWVSVAGRFRGTGKPPWRRWGIRSGPGTVRQAKNAKELAALQAEIRKKRDGPTVKQQGGTATPFVNEPPP